MKTKQSRIATEKRAKKRVVSLVRDIWRTPEILNDHYIGVMAATHNKPCSCSMCANINRKLNGLTLKERKANLKLKEETYE
jgi:ferredoxin-fold anticodon binding domain-containing protein